MDGADGEGGRDRIVGYTVARGHGPHELAHRPPVLGRLAQEDMEDRAARIAGLELILVVEGVKQVVSGASGKLARIGIIWLRAARGHDVRPLLPIMPREAVGGRFSGRGLEVEELARNLLVVLEAEPHVFKDLEGEGPPLLRLYTLAEEVEAAFVHAHEAYRVEVVVEAAEVAARVGKEAARQGGA